MGISPPRWRSPRRWSLGDWRDPISWPAEIFDDRDLRSSFYAGLGFNHALTDFPADAFQEGLEISGLRDEPITLFSIYGPPIPTSGDPWEEEGFVRTNTAHDWLQRLESQVRAFIDGKMTQAFGRDWARHRLPGGLYEKWQEKKVQAAKMGAPDRPLIAYADFTDYAPIICRTDNWRQVFVVSFRRPENVREAFQRLHPIRLDTMHARPITQDDELLLYAEARRLSRMIMAVAEAE